VEPALSWHRPKPDPNAEKLHRIQAVTDAALSSLQLDDLLAELLERTRDLLSVDTATILLLNPDENELIATAARGLEEEVRQGVRIPVGAGFAGRVAALAQPVVLDHVDHSTVVNRILIDKNLTAMAGVPMLAGEGVIGVLHVGSIAPRQFSADDIELLRVVADRASLATQARLAQLDRVTTLALQRSLLPARPPAVPGLDVAARYIPGAQVGVGGDWYDLFRLPSGEVGIVIGDVAGSGLRAAVVMGRIRSASRAYALETSDPADVLSRLDRKIQLFEPGAMATTIYAVMSADQTTVTLSIAGHLPPLCIDSDGRATRLDATADLPLGAYPGAVRHNTRTDLPPGGGLLLYTDGLVERRDRFIDDGIDALRLSVRAGSAEEICAAATAKLLADQSASDDIALLVVRRVEAIRPA
jgi:phosphoserine phosphatase RsbU/P